MLRQYTIMVDDREKRPLLFPAHITMLNDAYPALDKAIACVKIVVERATLRTGDYLLKSHPDRIIVERKGHLGEVAGNVFTTQGRRRFVDECNRLRSECDYPILLLEGSVAQLVRQWRKDTTNPWLMVDALQRLCLEHGVSLRYLPTTASGSKRAVGEEVAHLLINGAITCLPAKAPTTTCTTAPEVAPS